MLGALCEDLQVANGEKYTNRLRYPAHHYPSVLQSTPAGNSDRYVSHDRAGQFSVLIVRRTDKAWTMECN